MTFILGRHSMEELDGAHPDLRKYIKHLIRISPLDFKVMDVVRTPKEQDANIKKGVSQIKLSRHLTGHAADLGVLIKNSVTYDWKYYYVLAVAARQASLETTIPIIWGGVWDHLITDLSEDIRGEVEAYTARRKAIAPGKKVLLDGPHFELPRQFYP